MHQSPGRLDARCHVGEPEGNRLVLDDRRAERLALARIVESGLVSGARHTDGLGGDADAPGLQIGECDSVAVAFIAEQQVRRELDVLEGDLTGPERR